MNWKPTILIALLLAMLAAACGHDDGNATLRLQSEGFGHGAKMVAESNTTLWTAADTLWVNGNAYGISVDASGYANVSVPTAATYNAVFPAAIVAGNASVHLPAVYHYRTDAQGRQLLDVPMVASSDGEALFFYHITGALTVKYINNRSNDVTLDWVSVTSDNYAICGNRALTFGDTTQAPLASANAADKKVTIYFDQQETVLAAGDTLTVMLPVAPVGSDNHFTIEVSCHIAGDRYTISNTQQTGHPLNRNSLGYAYMRLDGTTGGLSLFQYTGSGTDITMHINNAYDFYLMVDAINNGWTWSDIIYSTFKYSIGADIDMSGYAPIEPISGYTGSTFNGDNHTISNLTITSTSEYCALFDVVTSTITNLTLSNVRLYSNGSGSTRYISPLIGKLSSTTLNNCTTSVAHVSSTSANIIYGGIAATTGTNTTISQCSTSTHCTIDNATKITYGGIIGNAQNDITCNNCSTTNALHFEATNDIIVGGAIGNGKIRTITLTSIICVDSIYAESTTGTIYEGGLSGWMNKNNSMLTARTCTIKGILSAYSINPIYIGKVYGYGKFSYQYNYSSWNYDASQLTIPPASGSIISGDPTGTY